MILKESEQIRLANSCFDAMFAYARAMNAASAYFAGEVCDGLQVSAGQAESSRYGAGRGKKASRVPSRGRGVYSKSRRQRLAEMETGGDRDRNAAERADKGSSALNRYRDDAPTDDLAQAIGDVWALPWQAMAVAFAQNEGMSPSRRYAPVGANGPAGAGSPAAYFDAWLNMDWMQPPATWPMAYSMMVAGVPRGVAFPFAQANLSTMEGAQIVMDAFARAFPGFDARSMAFPATVPPMCGGGRARGKADAYNPNSMLFPFFAFSS